MRDLKLACQYNVQLHTHIAKTKEEEAFCLARFGRRPAAYAAHLDWVGEDVWWAHCIHLDKSEIELVARTGTAVVCGSATLPAVFAPAIGLNLSMNNDTGLRS